MSLIIGLTLMASDTNSVAVIQGYMDKRQELFMKMASWQCMLFSTNLRILDLWFLSQIIG
jgi:hypothetical protein